MELLEKLEPYQPLLVQIGQAILIFIVGWIISKWVNRLTLKSCRKSKVDEALARFLASIFQYTVLAAALIAALAYVGIQTTSLIAVFASAGLAVGLALQGSLSNFASGVMILFFRPFSLGDKVTAGGETGKVVDIGLFATILLTPDNNKIIIPNSSVTGNTIVNFTVEGTLRGGVDVGVAYGVEVEKVIPVLDKAARETELVLQDPAPAVAFVSLGASSLDFKVLAWCQSGDFIPMQHNLRCSVYKALNEAGVEIPFNQIVVHQAE